MPYIIYKSDGSKLTTVNDASLDNSTTDISFVGKNYSGYGQIVNDNFLKLLENFSNSVAPTKPLRGQLWYDSSNKSLKVYYDGKGFKSLANIFIQNYEPPVSLRQRGDLWWDSDNFQLKAFDGAKFSVIGPISPSSTSAYWIPGREEGNEAQIVPVLKAAIASSDMSEDIVTVISNQTVRPTNPVQFSYIGAGITLKGTTETTVVFGEQTIPVIRSSGNKLWGSASYSDYATTATTALIANQAIGGHSDDVRSSTSTINTTYYSTASVSTSPYTIVQRTDDGSINVKDVRGEILYGTATSARYADLAERYESDNQYDVGTVLVIGGTKEVTVSNKHADTAVIGIVSKNPAYMMNSDAGNDETHPYIALKGRVPCKVAGVVKKGDLLVTSIYAGYATAMSESDHPSSVIGKALEDNNKSLGIIEVLVV